MWRELQEFELYEGRRVVVLCTGGLFVRDPAAYFSRWGRRQSLRALADLRCEGERW